MGILGIEERDDVFVQQFHALVDEYCEKGHRRREIARWVIEVFHELAPKCDIGLTAMRMRRDFQEIHEKITWDAYVPMQYYDFGAYERKYWKEIGYDHNAPL